MPKTGIQTSDGLKEFGGGGGHEILDSSGTAVASRSKLQFNGATVIDDNTNNKTIVTPIDTKNTAGSTDSSSKLYLIGATSQAANPQTYSQDTAYVGTDGNLYSGSKIVATQNMISDAWNSATSYIIGDYCIKNNILYKAKLAGTNKNPSTQTSYWEEVNIASQLKNSAFDTYKLIYYGEHKTFDKVYKASDSYVTDPGDKGGLSIYNEGLVTNTMINVSAYKGIKLRVATNNITCIQLCKSKDAGADNGPGPYHSVTKPTSWGGDTNFSANTQRYIVADSTNKYWEMWVPFSDVTLNGDYYIAIIQWGRVWSHIPEMILL